MLTLKVRALETGDMDALVEFIVEAYHDYPLATWFPEEPTKEDIERIFYNKIRGIGSRLLVDIINDDNGTIAGECEVVKIAYDAGVVGIIVRHGYRDRHVGTRMLDEAIDRALEIGINKFSAEVAEDNKEAMKFFIGNGFAPSGYRDVERGGRTLRIVVLNRQVR